MKNEKYRPVANLCSRTKIFEILNMKENEKIQFLFIISLKESCNNYMLFLHMHRVKQNAIDRLVRLTTWWLWKIGMSCKEYVATMTMVGLD